MSEPQSPNNQEHPPATMRELLLAQAIQSLMPLIQLWVSQGVGFPELSRAIRGGFIEAAEKELQASRAKITDASLSLLSGVHRKEVKSYREEKAQLETTDAVKARAHGLSLAEQVFTRWTTDAAYRDGEGNAAELALSGPAPSFESLAASITKDFSRRTVLDELVRLGLVKAENDTVRPLSQAMIPNSNAMDVAKYFHEQMHDHFAAGVNNLRAAPGDKRFLDHSMYVNGVSDLTIEQLSHLARTQWKSAFDAAVNTAQQRYQLEQHEDRKGRFRFGVYIYAEPDRAETNGPSKKE
jgi:hypothetical protein